MDPLYVLRTGRLNFFADLMEVRTNDFASLIDFFGVFSAIFVRNDRGLLSAAILAFGFRFSGRGLSSLLFFA